MAATLTALAWDNISILEIGVTDYRVILPYNYSTPVVSATPEDGATAVKVTVGNVTTITVTEGAVSNVYTITFYPHEVGLVGWKQTTNSTLLINSANKTSRSGRYFNGGLINPENLLAVQSDKDMTVEQFNGYLAELTTECYKDVLKAVFKGGIIENKLLYPYADNWQTFTENEGDFVGYEIIPAKNRELTVKVNSIFAEFESVGTLTLYLFHTSQKEAVSTLTVTLSAKKSIQTVCDWVLKHTQAGRYLIGYFTDTLVSKALHRNFQLSNLPANYLTLGIRPIKVIDWVTRELPDLSKIQYTADSYGLNFDISGLTDYSEMMAQNENSFSQALRLAVSCRILNEIATSQRSNGLERGLKGEALFELNGNRMDKELPYSVGLVKTFEEEIEKLQRMFKGDVIQRGTVR